MTLEMNDSEAVTLEQVEKLLKASKGWKSKGLTRDDKYKWLDSAIRRFDYYSRRKKEKGLLRRYMMRIVVRALDKSTVPFYTIYTT